MTRGVSFRQWAKDEIQKIHQAGLFKNERVILSPQGSDVQTREGAAVNFCANNYLGLGESPRYPGGSTGRPGNARLWHGLGSFHLWHTGPSQTTGREDFITERGFQIPDGIHPIVAILIGDEKTTVEMAADLNRRGIFVVGFRFPLVPTGQARIRVQVSAAHSGEQLDFAVAQFEDSARGSGDDLGFGTSATGCGRSDVPVASGGCVGMTRQSLVRPVTKPPAGSEARI